jgi:hypothetical protein
VSGLPESFCEYRIDGEKVSLDEFTKEQFARFCVWGTAIIRTSVLCDGRICSDLITLLCEGDE